MFHHYLDRLVAMDERSQMKISVVIPSYNRRASVCALVAALMAQHQPHIATEIIVVLDGSTDGSADALAQLTPPAGMTLRVYTQPNQGPGIARNTGWRHARGEIVLFLDDDVLPGARLLAAHLEAHHKTGADAILGRIETHAADWVSDAIAQGVLEFYSARHRRLVVDSVAITAVDVATGNLSVQQSRLLEVGGFDESFTRYGSEDIDLGQRLLEVGATFAYAPNAVVTHRFALTSKQWLQHMWQMGRSQVRLTMKHPKLKPYTEIGTLHDPNWKRRLAAQFAIQFPRLAMATTGVLLHLMPLISRLRSLNVLRQLAGLSWRLAFWSGVRSRLGSARAVRSYCSYHARILTYHRVCDDPSSPLKAYTVRPRAFWLQLRLLKWLGYHVIPFKDLIEAFETGRPVGRAIVLTFDDGYLDTFTTAAPILASYGFPATVFVVTNFVGTIAAWDAHFGSRMPPLATWEQLRALREQGWEIGLHSATHPDLTTLSTNALMNEIVQGEVTLEYELQSPASTFAYPYGAYSPAVVAAVARCGVRAAVTVDYMMATHRSPRYAMPRYIIFGNDSLLDFFLIVTVGHRFTTLLQRLLRQLRG